MIEGVGCVNSMEEVAMTCANMCGVQLAMVDIAAGKPLLYQFTWRIIRFIENRKTKNWMRNNSDHIAHLPMVLMGKIHQFFMHLALFSQNLINTNKIEVGDHKFKTKMVSTAVKLASKFFSKMQEPVDDNSIPKDVPDFARSIFVDAVGGGGLFTHQWSMNQKFQLLPLSQLKPIPMASVSLMAKSTMTRRSQGRSSPIRA